jgi:hypothetical protein
VGAIFVGASAGAVAVFVSAAFEPFGFDGAVGPGAADRSGAVGGDEAGVCGFGGSSLPQPATSKAPSSTKRRERGDIKAFMVGIL